MRSRLAVVGSCLFLALFLASCGSEKGVFVLINRSSEPILRATVRVCGQSISLKDIGDGKAASGSYEVRSDSGYDVAIEFSSGKILKKSGGYVTNGLDFRHRIVVTGSDIEIANDEASK